MDEFKVWAACRSIDLAAEYAERGRAYQALSDALLEEKWAAAFRSTVRHPGRADFRDLERDLSAEHKLRGRDVPHEAVAVHRKLLIAQIIAEFERSREVLKDIAAGVCAVPSTPDVQVH